MTGESILPKYYIAMSPALRAGEVRVTWALLPVQDCRESGVWFRLPVSIDVVLIRERGQHIRTVFYEREVKRKRGTTELTGKLVKD